MKMKIAFNEMQLNNVSYERLVFDSHNIGDRYILLDDVNEKRWKVKIKACQALKITANEYSGINFFKGGDFPDNCFIDGEDHPIGLSFIMEVEDSKWIKQLKKSLRKDSESAEYMDRARHFLIPCYENIIEIIAWDIEIVEAEQETLR